MEEIYKKLDDAIKLKKEMVHEINATDYNNEEIEKKKSEYQSKIEEMIESIEIKVSEEKQKAEKSLDVSTHKYEDIKKSQEDTEINMNNMKNPSKKDEDLYKKTMKKSQTEEKKINKKMTATKKKIKDLEFINKYLSIEKIERLSKRVEKNLPQKTEDIINEIKNDNIAKDSTSKRTSEQQEKIDKVKAEIVAKEKRKIAELKNNEKNADKYKIIISAEDEMAYIYCGSELLGKINITGMSPSRFNYTRNNILGKKEIRDRLKQIMNQKTAMGLRHLDPAVISAIITIKDNQIKQQLLDSYIKSALDKTTKMSLVEYNLEWSSFDKKSFIAYQKLAKRLVKRKKVPSVAGLYYGKNKKVLALKAAEIEKLQEEAENNFNKIRKNIINLFNEKGVNFNTPLGDYLQAVLNRKIKEVRGKGKISEKVAKELIDFNISEEVSLYIKEMEDSIINLEDEMSFCSKLEEIEELKSKIEKINNDYKRVAINVYLLELDTQIECSVKLKKVIESFKKSIYDEAMNKIETICGQGKSTSQISKMLIEYIQQIQYDIETNKSGSRTLLIKFDPYNVISEQIKDMEKEMFTYKKGSEEAQTILRRQANKELFEEIEEKYRAIVKEICELKCDNKIERTSLLDETINEQNAKVEENDSETSCEILIQGEDDAVVDEDLKISEALERKFQTVKEFKNSLRVETPINHEKAILNATRRTVEQEGRSKKQIVSKKVNLVKQVLSGKVSNV